MFKPLSIKTEFRFNIKREFINKISDSFEGGMFENLDIVYGRKETDGSCSVSYSLSTTIQSIRLKNITPDYVYRIEKKFKDKFFSRISMVKNKIEGEIKTSTTVTFIDKIYLGKK
jgi:hypothetical protein